MPHAALPTSVSPNRAAILMGRSRRHVDELIRAWLLPTEGRVHKRIKLADLEAFLGREVTLDAWAASERRVERMRAIQRDYNINRSTAPLHTESPSSVRPAA